MTRLGCIDQDLCGDRIDDLIDQLAAEQLLLAASCIIYHAVERIGGLGGPYAPRVDVKGVACAIQAWLRDDLDIASALVEVRKHNHAYRDYYVKNPRKLRDPFCLACGLAQMLESVHKGAQDLRLQASHLADRSRDYAAYAIKEPISVEGSWQITYLESLLTGNITYSLPNTLGQRI